MLDTDHLLELYDEGEEELGWSLIHPDICLEILEEPFGYVHPECTFEMEVMNCGNESMHPWPTKPGKYPIEFWSEEIKLREGTEYDAGIRVLGGEGQGVEP